MAMSMRRVLLASTGVVAFIAGWWLLSLRYDAEQLPGPGAVAEALREMAANGKLWRNSGISLLRFAGGYALAVMLALPLGLLLGWSRRSLVAADPLIQLLRPISPIAWFPLAVLWFGIGNAPAIFIITLAAFFPVLLATVSAVRSVPVSYLRIAANLGASRLLTARAVVLPAAFPTIVVGLRIALGTAWIHLVAGEMLGAQSGLGFLIVDSRNFLRTDLIIAGMLVIGILGLVLDRLIGMGERRLRAAWGQA
jgi:NitT/TauT family transport system permease protein